MRRRIRLRAFAKVNYAFEIRGLREDGYHEVETVLQSISLSDEVEIECGPAPGGSLLVEPASAETGPPEKNTACRAWRLLEEAAGRELPARVRLGKEIPSGAGLGGASADAAAVLVGLDRLFGLGLGTGELRRIGARVGADVPFCISGGTALGEGVGEVLHPLPAPPEHHLVVAKPAAGAGTGEVYRAYDALSAPVGAGGGSVGGVSDALRSGDLKGMARAAGNVLAPVARGMVPEVGQYEELLLRAGALGAAMSGSGTAVYGIFRTSEEAREAEAGLGAHFSGVYRPVDRGVEVLGR
ncbi:MAG: 4-(cytidine 5'-diphospho)-2-C-methyl-D-erythritol kinase [Rubrobacter sp.]|nr:4-(cytidine 5'-diphospho)-2-C-methyl-D-erythritol kinase [Rubrobacter sp.]